MDGTEVGLGALAALVTLLMFGMPIGPALIAVAFTGLWLLKGWHAAAGALGIIPYHFAANWVAELAADVPAARPCLATRRG